MIVARIAFAIAISAVTLLVELYILASFSQGQVNADGASLLMAVTGCYYLLACEPVLPLLQEFIDWAEGEAAS